MSAEQGDKLIFLGITFDDFVDDEHGHVWTQICPRCVNKHSKVILQKWLDDGAGGICGVQGCKREAEYYLDFPEKYDIIDGVVFDRS